MSKLVWIAFALSVVVVSVLYQYAASPMAIILKIVSDLAYAGFFYLGLFTGIRALATWVKRRRRRRNGALISEIYGLDHGLLNIDLPVERMWMNMGYWKDTDDFPTACRALLIQVLQTANVMRPYPDEDYPRSRQLIDLGFGCADQTEFLMRQAEEFEEATGPKGVKRAANGKEKAKETAFYAEEWTRETKGEQQFPKFDQYVGITKSKTQFSFAKWFLNELGLLNQGQPNYVADPVQIFCGDAANPTSWPRGMQQATVYNLDLIDEEDTELRKKQKNTMCNLNYRRSRWVLALDTFYHFSPSRWPIIKYAHDTLGASIMAYDLVLAENVLWHQRVLLYLICALTGSPYQNFVTAMEYREKLQEAGYGEKMIEMRDITDEVFTPLFTFLQRREVHLRYIGLSLGRYSAAKWLYGWWASTGIVRAVIVVAHR